MTTLHSAEIIYLFDMLGVVACAAAGTIVAKRKSGDILGAIFISFVAAIGGGSFRDILLDNHPIFWMTQPSYLGVIVATSLIVQILFHYVERLDKPLRLFDALGAATFTVIGIEIGLANGATPVVAILMGITTATVGGIMRDIICNEMPMLLQKEIYITACLAGSILYFILLKLGVPQGVQQLSVIGFIFSIRMLAIYRNWQLPNITLQRTKH